MNGTRAVFTCLLILATAGIPEASAAETGVCAGIISDLSGNTLTLSAGKRNVLRFALTPETWILQEQDARFSDLTAGILLRIAGEGCGNTVAAKRMTLLPGGQTWDVLRKNRQAGPAFPSARSVALKAKVVSARPLIVVSTQNQELFVVLAPGGRVQRLVPREAQTLRIGMRVQVVYQGRDGVHKALEVITPNTSPAARR